jgi:galactonate dehydratase
MKITDVKSFPVWYGPRNLLLVKVETDAGIYGWGEGGLSSRELAVAGAVKHYREWLIGKDPMKRGALWQEMYRSQYFEGGRTLSAAISAIDIALYDIAGKALNVPVYQLLGGKQRDYVQGFATTGGKTVGEAIENARQLLDQGWQAIRFFPRTGWADEQPGDTKRARDEVYPRLQGQHILFEPRASIAETAAWLVQVREALGHAPVLGIDYHHRLNVAEAASFCQMLPPHTLDFLEEPIRDETPEAYEALRKMTEIPLAIGEECASKWQFLPYIERGITNYARLDVCNVGGFTEALKVAGWCEAHYIDVMPHNPLGPVCTAATVHLSAAVPNFSWTEVQNTLFWEEPEGRHDGPVFPEQIRLEGHWYPVPDGPGLGIEVNEEALARYFAFYEMPHLHKSDGSHTNW